MFCQDESLLKEIRNCTNEDLTYRTFTMFNFFGENVQGKIQDFLDKCSDIKYSVKLNPILNFIFNNHLDKIFALQQELNELSSQLKELEVSRQRYDFIINQVNSNLLKLGGSITYTGRNAEDIKRFSAFLRTFFELKEEQQKMISKESFKEKPMDEILKYAADVTRAIQNGTITKALVKEISDRQMRQIIRNLSELNPK